MNAEHIQQSIERAREAGFHHFADGIAQFAQHSQVVRPLRVTTEVRRPNPALLGTKEERDAFSDRMLFEERQREAKK